MDRDFKQYIVDESSSMLKRGTPSSSSYYGENLESIIYTTNNAGGSTTRKKQRGPAQPQIPPVCQVEGCNTDLRDSKGYHRRHRVCEIHSKTPRSVVDGIEQRFCQQCSRFHVLEEFDDGKRSCRKRLAGHNERRRKPPASAELLIGSSSRISIFPGDFKHYVPPVVQHPQQNHQHQQHILDGSFLSSWPTEPSKVISKPVESAHMLYQSYIQQRDSPHLQEGLYQFLKPNTQDATSASLLLPPPCSTSDALSLLSAGHQKSALSSPSLQFTNTATSMDNKDSKDTGNSSTSSNLQYYRRPDFFNSGLQISGSRTQF